MLKKSLSSFDELEVISINGVSNAQDADEVIDLTGSIADALKDYETDVLLNTMWFADRVVNIPSSVRENAK